MNTAPALNFEPALLLKAQGVRVAFFDVDGVLTDGGLLFSEAGESLKRFNTLDGHGLKLLQQGGITPVVITGRDSKPLRLRLQALGIVHAHFGTEDKLPAAEQTLATLGLDWSQAAADDGPSVSGAEFDAAIEVGQGLVIAPHLPVSLPAGGEGPALVGVELDSAIADGQGPLVAPIRYVVHRASGEDVTAQSSPVRSHHPSARVE